MDECADNLGTMYITLYRKDAQEENPRYYYLHDRQGQLFDRFSFTTAWSSGKNIREKTWNFGSQSERDEFLRSLLKRKFRQGYAVLYSYFRPGDSTDVRGELLGHNAG